MDLIDEIRFVFSGPRSVLLPLPVPVSISVPVSGPLHVAENDRFLCGTFLGGERKDAGDMEDCLSASTAPDGTAARDDMGGRRFSSIAWLYTCCEIPLLW